MPTWVDYDTQFVRRRYNRLAPIHIAFEIENLFLDTYFIGRAIKP